MLSVTQTPKNLSDSIVQETVGEKTRTWAQGIERLQMDMHIKTWSPVRHNEVYRQLSESTGPEESIIIKWGK